MLYSHRSWIVFGFHACTQQVAERLISSDIGDFRPSKNSYDWLGHGMYFWENSLHRAEYFAKDRDIKNPKVVGASIHLGHCLDLTDSGSLSYLSVAYNTLKKVLEVAGKPLPKNKSPKSPQSARSGGDDLLLRELDCAVINFLHSQRAENNLKPYDSVRGVFWEGNELYPGAGFKEMNHVQLCIRNPNCIKGYFWPRKKDDQYNFV